MLRSLNPDNRRVTRNTLRTLGMTVDAFIDHAPYHGPLQGGGLMTPIEVAVNEYPIHTGPGWSQAIGSGPFRTIHGRPTELVGELVRSQNTETNYVNASKQDKLQNGIPIERVVTVSYYQHTRGLDRDGASTGPERFTIVAPTTQPVSAHLDRIDLAKLNSTPVDELVEVDPSACPGLRRYWLTEGIAKKVIADLTSGELINAIDNHTSSS